MTCGSCACFANQPCHVVHRHVEAGDLACPSWHRAEGPAKCHPVGELIYLASPYSHKDASVRQHRFEAVCLATGKLMCAGNHVFSPIAHSHPIALATDLPTDFSFWDAYCRVMLSRCTKLVVIKLPGWQESVGVQAEIRMAREMGIPAEELEP